MYGTSGEVEAAGEHQRWAGRSDVQLSGAAIPEFFNGEVFQLGTPDDGIFANDDAVAFDDLFDRNKFHFGNQVAGMLGRRSVTSTIARSVFDEGPSVGFT